MRPSTASRTHAEDLNGVGHVNESVLLRSLTRPSFHRWSFDLFDATAGSADQMVVVPATALPVQDLTVLVAQRVYFVGVHHRLQAAVDGGQTHGLTATAQQVMEVLGAAEHVGVVHRLSDDESLLRPSAATTRSLIRGHAPESTSAATARTSPSTTAPNSHPRPWCRALEDTRPRARARWPAGSIEELAMHAFVKS
jgi:hypothetical protein